MYTFRRSFAGALAAALVVGAGALPGLAGASGRAHPRPSHARVAGTVVASSTARHTLVVAGRGRLETLRVGTSSAAQVAAGTRVTARVVRLSDGTDRVIYLRERGRHSRVHFRAVVVSASASTLTVSGGNSLVAMSRTTVRHSNDRHAGGSSTIGTGSVVSVRAHVNQQGLDETGVSSHSTTPLIGLEGTISALGGGTLSVTSEDNVTVSVTVPASITLPTGLALGQRVELVTSYLAGIFTLVTIDLDGSATQTTQGVSQNQNGNENQLHVEGVVVSSSSTSLTIQPGDGAAPVSLTVPAGLDVTKATVGAYVHVSATLVNDVLTLTRLYVEGTGAPEATTTQVEGVVVSNANGTLVVQPGDGATPVSITVPSGVDATAGTVGTHVHAVATVGAGGTLTLVHLRVQASQDTSGPGQVYVEGRVLSVTVATQTVPGTLVILPGDGAAPVTLVLPVGVTTPSLSAGANVRVQADLQGGALAVVSIRLTD